MSGSDTAEHEPLVRILAHRRPGEPEGRPESMWALPRGDGLYELRNVPFDRYGLNWGDVVRCTEADGHLPELVELVERGGHRTVRVIFNDDALGPDGREPILAGLNEREAFYEHASGRLYAVDVEPQADYDAVFSFLAEHHEAGVLIFEEAWREDRTGEQPAPDWL